MFCPICGRNKMKQEYCDRCGSPIEAAAASSSEQVMMNPNVSFGGSQKKVSRWRSLLRETRFHSLWILALIIVVTLGTGWIRWFVYGDEWAIDDTARAIEDKNTLWLADRLVRSNDTFYTFEELLPFTQNADQNIQQHLELTAKPIAKKWGLIPVYGVEIQSIRPVLKTNLIGAEWFVNGEAVTLGATDDAMRWKLPAMLPQPIILVGVNETPYGLISNIAEWNPTRWNGEAEPHIEAPFEYRSVEFTTDMKGVQLIINSVPIGDIPYPQGLELRLLPSQASIRLQKKTPWGEVNYETGQRSLEQGAEYHLSMKDKMARSLYPSLKQTVAMHVQSFVKGAQNLDLEQVSGITQQGKESVGRDWEPFLADGYYFQGRLLQLDFYPDQLEMFADDRLQMLATLHFDNYDWATKEGKEYYNEASNEKTYAYDLIFENGEWKVHSYRPVEAFIYGEKESILMEEENAPIL
jgi:hypothetical protein